MRVAIIALGSEPFLVIFRHAWSFAALCFALPEGKGSLSRALLFSRRDASPPIAPSNAFVCVTRLALDLQFLSHFVSANVTRCIFLFFSLHFFSLLLLFVCLLLILDERHFVTGTLARFSVQFIFASLSVARSTAAWPQLYPFLCACVFARPLHKLMYPRLCAWHDM